jgi:hypothetical protein
VVDSNDALLPGKGMVGRTVTYWKDSSSEYWGQGRGMAVGLKTEIQVPGEQKPHLLAWGVNQTWPGEEVTLTVEAKLMPGTGQNVTVTGNHTVREAPYMASLVSHFKDGKNRERKIEGILYQVL